MEHRMLFALLRCVWPVTSSACRPKHGRREEVLRPTPTMLGTIRVKFCYIRSKLLELEHLRLLDRNGVR